jgi:hypothetical protein
MTDMTDSDSNTLARIDERTQALTASLALHVKDDAEKFEKVFSVVGKRFDKIDEKLDTLWDEKTARKGAMALSKVLTGGIYAAIALAAGYFGGHK